MQSKTVTIEAENLAALVDAAPIRPLSVPELTDLYFGPMARALNQEIEDSLYRLAFGSLDCDAKPTPWWGRHVSAAQTFGRFFAFQFLSYGIFCWSARAIALASLPNVALSDLLFSALGFTIIRNIAESADTRAARYGYIAGSVVGSVFSVWLTRRLFGR